METNLEYIRLVRLEDEARNYLRNGYLFANPDAEPQSEAKHDARSEKSQIFVFGLSCEGNIATTLNLKVFCDSFYPTTESSPSSPPYKLSRVYNATIMVPKYSMFALAKFELVASGDRNKAGAGAGGDDRSQLIKLRYQLNDRSKVQQVSFEFELLQCCRSSLSAAQREFRCSKQIELAWRGSSTPIYYIGHRTHLNSIGVLKATIFQS